MAALSPPPTLAEARAQAYSSVPSAALNRSIRDLGAAGRGSLASELLTLKAKVAEVEWTTAALLGGGLGLAYGTRMRLLLRDSQQLQLELQAIVDKIVAINQLEAPPGSVAQVKLAAGGGPQVGLAWFAWAAIAATVSLIGIGTLTAVGAIQWKAVDVKAKVENNLNVARDFNACLSAGHSSEQCEPILRLAARFDDAPGLPWWLWLVVVGGAGYGAWWWWRKRDKQPRLPGAAT